MSSLLEEFTKRAQETEDKLKSLEAQIDALAASTLSAHSRARSQQQRKQREEKCEWEVLYWPVKNRGNFVKLAFEEAGVPYKDISDQKELFANIRSDRFGKQTYEEGGPYQAMAPPMIRNGDFMLSQSVVCMGYIAEKYGIRPRSNEDHARAQMLANNASDVISELYQYREKGKEEIFSYLDGRFQAWLDLFEKPLKTHSLTYYFDGKCTQADLAVFNALDGIEELFGDDTFRKYVADKHAYLNKYYEALKQRESIKRLMQKQQGWYSFAPSFGWEKTRKVLRGQDTVLTFKSDEIIPDVVDEEPLNVLRMEYKFSNTMTFKLTEMGQTMAPSLVRYCPVNLQFDGCDAKKLYTVILTDPDARDREKHEFREWIHFVKINVKGSDLTNSGDVMIEYVGSGPPKGSGLHRYVWLVYEQPNGGQIDVAKCGQKKLIAAGGNGEGRRSWKARNFVKHNKLGPLVAGTYYNAQYDDFVPTLYAWLQGAVSSLDT